MSLYDSFEQVEKCLGKKVKGARKFYFAHIRSWSLFYPIRIIESAFPTYSDKNLLFRLSMFCVFFYSVLNSMSSLCTCLIINVYVTMCSLILTSLYVNCL